jgi:hypothetical protein
MKGPVFLQIIVTGKGYTGLLYMRVGSAYSFQNRIQQAMIDDT